MTVIDLLLSVGCKKVYRNTTRWIYSLFFRRLSLFNFINKIYFSVFKSWFENFHLCRSGRIVAIPPLNIMPFFELFKLFRLCSVHVIKLTFLTTSQILWLTFVAPPLFLKAFNCEVTIMYVVGALHGRIFISARVGITMLVLFLLLRLFIFIITIANPYRTIVLWILSLWYFIHFARFYFFS